LIAESDGSSGDKQSGHWYGRHWCRLAVYAVGGKKPEYLAVIQFHSHPAKEPFQVAGRIDSTAGVAAFFLSCDPLNVLRNNNASGLDLGDIQRRYDFQLRDLLVAFSKAVPGQFRSQEQAFWKSLPLPLTKGARPCFADLFSLVL
jgi:hypothetical protein